MCNEKNDNKSKFYEIEAEKLKDFFMWFRENGEKYIGMSVEQLIDTYLQEQEARNE